ncbi:MAG: DUF998 domain-containing protein, partial [Trebonia sp.]
MDATETPSARSLRARWPGRVWLWSGVAVAPGFLATALLEGASRRGYDPVRHPISALALTGRGWRQTANFLGAGALT